MQSFHPPHIYQDQTIYFITAKTINGLPLFNTHRKKDIFLQVFSHLQQEESINVFAWVLHDNHYHVLLKTPSARAIIKFITRLHASTARLLNTFDKMPQRKVWYQYWDRCIRSERDFWERFNYIHHNPVKHGYVTHQEALKEYPYSSYQTWHLRKGETWMASCFMEYPIIDFSVENDD